MSRIKLSQENIHEGALLLVNAAYPLRNIQTRDLISVDEDHPNIFLRRDAAHVLQMMLDELGGRQEIVPVSGYRSAEEQTEIFEDSLRENGEEFTRQFVALPYHSEHQTGLAIDLGRNQEQIDFLCPDFPYEGICDRFRKAAPGYGFIQRYEKDKEQITGISHEPWHFRYVGYPHSQIMAEEGLALEEYIERIKEYREDRPYRFRRESGAEIQIYYVPADPGGEAHDGMVHSGEAHSEGVHSEEAHSEGVHSGGARIKGRGSEGKEACTQILLPDDAIYQISGNNVDGFIVTVWRR